MASFASSATMCSARKHAWTNKDVRLGMAEITLALVFTWWGDGRVTPICYHVTGNPVNLSCIELKLWVQLVYQLAWGIIRGQFRASKINQSDSF